MQYIKIRAVGRNCRRKQERGHREEGEGQVAGLSGLTVQETWVQARAELGPDPGEPLVIQPSLLHSTWDVRETQTCIWGSLLLSRVSCSS
jgi:hypothetical protein